MTDIKETDGDVTGVRDDSGLPVDKVVFGIAAALVGRLRARRAPSGPRTWPTCTGEVLGLDHRELRLAVRADQRGLRAVLRLPRVHPLRQHQARPRRLRAGVLDVLVGLDDVRHRHGHRPDVLGRRRAADPPQRAADGAWPSPGIARGGPAGDGVRLLPLGLPPVVDVRRDRPRRSATSPTARATATWSRRRSVRSSATGRRAGPGKAIDVIAIFATLFGSATSLGLGALQITGGIDDVFGDGRRRARRSPSS